MKESQVYCYRPNATTGVFIPKFTTTIPSGDHSPIQNDELGFSI